MEFHDKSDVFDDLRLRVRACLYHKHGSLIAAQK